MDFNSRANYDVYPLYDLSKREKLKVNYDDGGFRGWGSVFELDVATRKQYVWDDQGGYGNTPPTAARLSHPPIPHHVEQNGTHK